MSNTKLYDLANLIISVSYDTSEKDYGASDVSDLAHTLDCLYVEYTIDSLRMDSSSPIYDHGNTDGSAIDDTFYSIKEKLLDYDIDLDELVTDHEIIIETIEEYYPGFAFWANEKVDNGDY